MADVTIIDLTENTSIDRAADYIEITDASDGGNSKKSNVNSLLNITGAPVGTTDIQTLTNKTLTAPTVSSPVLSGTVTGTYTIGGTPTFPASVVTLTGNQTLTNKVLTSPTINTATIANPTLTVNTISEHTADNGVVVDGLTIKDSTLATANSVPSLALVAGSVTATKIEAQQEWQAPALQNSWVNYGDGFDPVGYMKDSLGFVHIKGFIKSGTTTLGTLVFTLPAGYRPAASSYYCSGVGSGSTINAWEVNAAGAFKVIVANATYSSIGHIIFKAA